MKKFFLFYFNFNIIISFYFHFKHDCCFYAYNGTNNPYMFFIDCVLNEYISSNIEGKIGEFYYIERVNGHGTFISGFIDFGNNCRIKIPTNNLISIYNLEPSNSFVVIDNNNFEKFNLKEERTWNISFYIY